MHGPVNVNFFKNTRSWWLPWHVTLCCNRKNYNVTRYSKAPVFVAPSSPVLTLSSSLRCAQAACNLHFTYLHNTKPGTVKVRWTCWSTKQPESSNEHSSKNRHAFALWCGSLLRHDVAIHFWPLDSLFAVVPPQMLTTYRSSSYTQAVTAGLLTPKKYGCVTRIKPASHQMFTFAIWRGTSLTKCCRRPALLRVLYYSKFGLTSVGDCGKLSDAAEFVCNN